MSYIKDTGSWVAYHI